MNKQWTTVRKKSSKLWFEERIYYVGIWNCPPQKLHKALQKFYYQGNSCLQSWFSVEPELVKPSILVSVFHYIPTF